jgi:spore maturation protein CgeB
LEPWECPFLRGLVSELGLRGHDVQVFEPADGWSVTNLIADHGSNACEEYRRYYPMLSSHRYVLQNFDVPNAVRARDLVIVHEWNDASLIRQLGELRRSSNEQFALLFHDTHHRSVSDIQSLDALGLSRYDGILAFGETVSEQYRRAGWARRCWVFHEAADVRVFRPMPDVSPSEDLVWIGNYGDNERSAELQEYLFEPAASLGLTGNIFGVRYPPAALRAVERSGLRYEGWLPNFQVPEVMAQHRLTVHIPRRPYAQRLKGIPTIRVFEALACGIPLICAPWEDSEHLFGEDDFLRVSSGGEMRAAMSYLLADEAARRELSKRGLRTILSRHTCAHRATQLESLAAELGVLVQPDRVASGS